MPEATVLYFVTAVVVIGLVIWVAAVLKTAKESWARPALAQSAELMTVDGLPDDGAATKGVHVDEPEGESGKIPRTIDADSTAKATPVALASEGNEGKTKPAPKDDEKKDEGAEI
jgi:hypothetical protein